MTEQQIQSKILKYLNSLPEAWAFKAESVTRGVPDIICCYRGLFVAFEVKTPKGKVSKIQLAVHRQISDSQGFVFTVRSLESVISLLNELESSWEITEKW